MHYRKSSNVKGHYRNGVWIAPHKRKESMVSDPTKHIRFTRPGKRYIFPEPKIISDLSRNDCLRLSYSELKMMIKKGFYSDVLLDIAQDKEEELFSSMSYDELLKVKKKGSYHCINYEMLLEYLDDYEEI